MQWLPWDWLRQLTGTIFARKTTMEERWVVLVTALGMVACLAGGAIHPGNQYGAPNSASTPPVALPLLTRMLDACDAWEAARWDLSRTNSIETATKMRIAGRKHMRYCDEYPISKQSLRESWPFDVDEFENALAQNMVCDKCGLYRVKGGHAERGGGLADDGNMAVNPSVRWINGKIEEWATNALDAVYRRLSKEETQKILGGDCVSDGTFCWNIGANEYFAVQRIDEDNGFEMRDYVYMRWDGEGEPVIAAAFNSMPRPEAMYAVRSCIAGDPVGWNNMAALIWNGVADRGETRRDAVRKFLEAAKKAGIAAAAENLNLM